MPVVLVDRLPLPSLQAYTAISVLLLSCSVYYAIQVTSDPSWKINATLSNLDIANDEDNVTDLLLNNEITSDGNNFTDEDVPRLIQVLYFMIQEPLCIWTCINMAYCCLILVGKFIQKLVFGELRVSEQQHIKDKFWNFVFYKFIFIFGVLNVQFMDEVISWCSWFSVLGFLHLLAQLAKDRFEYLSFSPTTPRWTHIRLLILLSTILSISLALFGICIVVGFNAGTSTFAFMAVECVLLNLRTLYVIVRYGIHLWDKNHEGVWENRGTYMYFAEFIFEMAALFIDFTHHLHMLLWGNIFLSMASLVICMQLRYLFYEMQRRVKKHKNYLRVVRHMERNYPMAIPEELESNSDDCAICWDKMETARKLPCGHLFHNSCLRSWLEQDTSCPTCRTALSDQHEQEANEPVPNNDNILAGIGTSLTTPDATSDVPQNRERAIRNHFFHFDGSRYVSWLPSFSVEVTHTPLLRDRQQVQTSQLDSMARQVQQMFSNMPLHVITNDLRVTRSIELTIENILEERLVAPPFQMQTNRNSSPQTLSSSESSSPSISESDKQMQSTSHVQEPATFFSGDLADEESIAEEVHSSFGGRFSKSSEERERMLSRRKEEMVQAARKKYIALNIKNNSNDTISRESPENRRHLAYEAAQRRLARQSSLK